MIDWDAHVIGPTVEVFGQSATFYLAGQAPFTRDGVFDEAYLDLSPADSMQVTTEMPILGIRLSQFPQMPAQDDEVVIDATGIRYKIREVRKDSHGHAVLKLNLIDCC